MNCCNSGSSKWLNQYENELFNKARGTPSPAKDSALRALPRQCGVSRHQTRAHSCFASCQLGCFGKCLVHCFACRQPCCLAHASLPMNKTAIPFEALNRFRAAASQYTHTSKSRASRLLTLKDDIAALRKRGISYRAIGELLTQSGIPASDTCVTNFCHRVLKEKLAHKSSAKRRASRHANRPASPNNTPAAPPNSTLPSAPTTTSKPTTMSTETSAFTSRGPRIAKVELLPPGETI
jgi:hypothetical protein